MRCAVVGVRDADPGADQPTEAERGRGSRRSAGQGELGELSDRQLTKNFEDANYNVIRQLGTALLGIGGANPVIVSTYGAGNTAYEGISGNFEASFLVAPNGRKVKEKVIQLLDQAETRVLGDFGSDKGDSGSHKDRFPAR